MDLAPFVAATVLSIEGRTWLYPGRKEAAVREALGLSMPRFYQLLNRLVDSELSLMLDPTTTYRVRRVRESRQRSRRLSA